jgi:dUTP pyrophosphatase
MLFPTFYTAPGNEAFMPVPAHPGEDAGADICACIDGYNEKAAISFHNAVVGQPPSAAVGVKGYLHVDGKKQSHLSRKEFTDLVAKAGGAVFLLPGQTVLVNSGFKVALNDFSELGAPWNSLVGYYQIVSRSGLAHKHNIVVTNSPGIIDSGYRDWVKVSLTNRGKDYHCFTHGARIAQGIYSVAVDQSGAVRVLEEQELGASARHVGGFGSTAV